MPVGREVDVGAGQVPVGSLRKQEHSQMGRGHPGIGGGGELVGQERRGPVPGPGPFRKAVSNIPFEAQLVQIVQAAAEHGPLLDRVGHPPRAQEARQSLGGNQVAVAADPLKESPVAGLVDVEPGDRDVDDHAQLRFIAFAWQVQPIEPGNDDRSAVGGRDVDHELLQKLTLLRVDTDHDTVGVADPHDDGPSAGVRHADEDLGELRRRAARFRSERDPVAAEDDLLQLQLGVFTGPNGGDERLRIHHHRGQRN